MSNTVITKSGLILLSVDTLVECVKRIESSMPGWWWSISQKKEEIFVTVGPGRNCPHEPDNQFALTREGDAGRSFDHKEHLGKIDEADLLESLDQFIASFIPSRSLPSSGKVVQVVHLGPPPYRRQTEANLKQLWGAYKVLLESITPIEQRGHQLNQVYIGSCDLSADCSLRGKRINDTEFDISFDMQGDTSIAESMVWALGELKSDVLTPR